MAMRDCQEIADYAFQDRRFRYYTAAVKHKGRLIFIEAYATPEAFDRCLPFFRKIIEASRLH